MKIGIIHFEPSRKRIRIGDLLVQHKLISEGQLSAALSAHFYCRFYHHNKAYIFILLKALKQLKKRLF